MQKLIDTHGYLGSNSLLRVEEKPDIYLRLKNRVISTAGISPGFLLMGYSAEDNYKIPRIISENPDMFLGGYLQVNANRNLENLFGYLTPSELEKIMDSEVIVALKVNTSATKTRADSRSLDGFLRLAMDYDLPVLFHCSATGQDFTSPDIFRRLRDRNPDLKVICAHYGGLEEKYILKYVELAEEDPNIYLNTSGLSGEIKRWDFDSCPPRIHKENNPKRWEQLFLSTIERIRSKVVFGSDYPELDFSLHPVSLADQDIQRDILYHNALRLFKLEGRF